MSKGKTFVEKFNSLLKEYFNYDEFKPEQKKVFSAYYNKKDILAILPTGYGKSLCYQIPALAYGKTLVISPLIALMQDQVNDLKEKNISAEFINSTNNKDHGKILNNFKNDLVKILYVSPEKLSQETFLNKLQTCSIKLFVVDEAHCIYQFGPDFRSDYSKLDVFRQKLGSPQIMALTATATKEVQKYLINKLKFKKNSEIIESNFDRPNLFFKNVYIPALLKKGGYDISNRCNWLYDYIINNKGKSGIIYARTRKDALTINSFLKNKKINSDVYHGKLNDIERDEVLKQFISDGIDIVVATSAFGLGVNKPNIRFVINCGLVDNIEDYYQQAGRAGRDGNPAECILIYDKYYDLNSIDFFIDLKFPDLEKLKTIWTELRDYYLQIKNKTSDINEIELLLDKYIDDDQRKGDVYPMAYYVFNQKFLIQNINNNLDKIPYFDMNLVWLRKKQAIDDKKMILNYATSSECLRSIILKRYGQEVSDRCNACFNCHHKIIYRSKTYDESICIHRWKLPSGEISSINAICQKCGIFYKDR